MWCRVGVKCCMNKDFIYFYILSIFLVLFIVIVCVFIGKLIFISVIKLNFFVLVEGNVINRILYFGVGSNLWLY